MQIKRVVKQDGADCQFEFECESCGHTHIGSGPAEDQMPASEFSAKIKREMVCRRCRTCDVQDGGPEIAEGADDEDLVSPIEDGVKTRINDGAGPADIAEYLEREVNIVLSGLSDEEGKKLVDRLAERLEGTGFKVDGSVVQ